VSREVIPPREYISRRFTPHVRARESFFAERDAAVRFLVTLKVGLKTECLATPFVIASETVCMNLIYMLAGTVSGSVDYSRRIDEYLL
jgi:hypothetical protein